MRFIKNQKPNVKKGKRGICFVALIILLSLIPLDYFRPIFVSNNTDNNDINVCNVK